VIAVGVWPNDRTAEYTRPGWEPYTRFVADRLVPAIDAQHRTRTGPEHRAVMGSSLGGVISLHLAWSRPEVFGMAACLSSTFGWQDDLFERVARGPKPPIRLWLDSGWPRDNYEATRAMADRLRAVGFAEGRDLLWFAFPDGRHSEISWATRVHLPLQFFFRDR
jgi:predicted alpha/beta superfamily hydrolase